MKSRRSAYQDSDGEQTEDCLTCETPGPMSALACQEDGTLEGMWAANTPYSDVRIGAAALSVLLSLAGGCSTTAPERDEICPEIARFANAWSDYSAHSVVLFTDWGGVFSEDKTAIAEKTCQRGQDTASRRLCNYLMENTSTEFAEVNMRRALSCLGPGARTDAGGPRSQGEPVTGKVTSLSVPGVRADVRVTVEFSTASTEHPPSLKISAEKIRP